MYELNAGLPPEWPVLALIFAVTVAVMLFGMAVVTMFRYERKRTDAPVPRVFGPLTPALAKLLPLPASSRAGTRKDLMRAGYFEPVAEENFSAIRAVITFLPLLACEAMAVMLDGRIAVAFFVVGLIAGAAGFIVPRIILSLLADQRMEQIRRGLPTFMDTLALNLSAGGSLPSAILATADAIDRGHPELAREVRVVTAHSQMRSLSHSLEQWKERMPLPELGSMVFLLGQGDRMGSDVTRGLWELSSSLQVNARQRAGSGS